MVPGGKIDVFPEGLAAPDLVEHYGRHALPCRRLPVRLPIWNWIVDVDVDPAPHG
jgi:hypothetical protein